MESPLLKTGIATDATEIVRMYRGVRHSAEQIQSVERAIDELPSVVARVNETIVGFAYAKSFAPT